MSQEDSKWSAARLISFRLLFIFWTLRTLTTSPLFELGGSIGEWIQRIINWPTRELALWVGSHIFHLTGIEATFHPTGSSDTALKWILALDSVILAILGSLLWTLLDSRRKEYKTLDAWLRMSLSFTLGATLLSYGSDKVLPSQFGSPSLYTLNETCGESSPMRLLWTFMAASKAYQCFTGWAEVTPGILLFFRRTRTLGALMGGAVMLNVVALNLFYDVPVKLFSTTLFLCALFLAGPDAKGIFRLFFLRQSTLLSADHIRRSDRMWLARAGRTLQVLILLFFIGTSLKRHGCSAINQTKRALLYMAFGRSDATLQQRLPLGQECLHSRGAGRRQAG